MQFPAALNVAPVHMFVPLIDGPVEIAPNLKPLAHEMRGWVRGQGALGHQDPIANQDRRAYGKKFRRANGSPSTR
jgi:hypothetical protein